MDSIATWARGPASRREVLIDQTQAAVWTLRVDDVGADDWPLLRALLSEDERARSERFHFEHDRRVYVAAHAICRGLLSYCAGRPPRDWLFSLEAHGKPEVVNPLWAPNLRVNISHTRGLAAAALTVDHDIGVDVERLDRVADADVLAARMFAMREREALAAVSPAQKHETFLAFWTLKEAYVKAIGKGLSQPLDAFSFDLETLQIRFENGDDDPRRWRFERFRLGAAHLMALGARCPDPARLTIAQAPAPLAYLRALAQG